MTATTLQIVAYVAILVVSLFGAAAKDWRASFGTLAVALTLLILLLVGRR